MDTVTIVTTIKRDTSGTLANFLRNLLIDGYLRRGDDQISPGSGALAQYQQGLALLDAGDIPYLWNVRSAGSIPFMEMAAGFG